MKMFKNKKAFTIVELVIVIAVIAILAAVLIPTFSGIVSKANQSSALQTAKSTLTNAVTMSSTASLPGQDANGNYQTVIVADGYAFGYTGNQLESIDYPGADGSAIAKLAYGTNYNAILVSSENIDGDKILNVAEVITKATDLEGDLAVVKKSGNYYVTNGSLVCALYLNADFSTEAIVFTTFAASISDELKEEVIDDAGVNGYNVKASGKGSSTDFGDIE